MPRYRCSTQLFAAAAVAVAALLFLALTALTRSYAVEDLDKSSTYLGPYVQRAKDVWRDRWGKMGQSEEDGSGDLALVPTTEESSLPACPRTLLVHLGRTHRGFGSLFNQLLRTSAVAEHYGYEVFVVEQDWMYGSLDDYFLRPNRSCSINGTPSWNERLDMYSDLDASAPLEWLAHNHLRETRTGSSVDYIDALFLSLFSSPSTLDDLHNSELASFPPQLPLGGSSIVPEPMYGMMEVLEAQTRKWWRLQPEVEVLVEQAKEEIQREVKERGRQRPVVGVHVRLGDKCGEMHNPSYSVLRYANSSTLARFRSSLGSSCGQTPSSEPFAGPLDHSTALIYASAIEQAACSVSKQWRTKTTPLVLVMSDDERVTEQLAEVVSDAEVRALSEFGKAASGEEVEEKGFSSKKFGDLPLEYRVSSTRRFVRDLTLLSSLADAFVFTGSSNVGRLLAVLGGTEKAIAGRDWSCDVRWFPTARYA